MLFERKPQISQLILRSELFGLLKRFTFRKAKVNIWYRLNHIWQKRNLPNLPIGEAEEKCTHRGRKKREKKALFFFSFHHLRIQLIQNHPFLSLPS